jgi:hypothetical protein
MQDFQDLASELAFLRERIVRGAAPPGARGHEEALLTSMAALRRQFLPGTAATVRRPGRVFSRPPI